jgi:hypothetical protein
MIEFVPAVLTLKSSGADSAAPTRRNNARQDGAGSEEALRAFSCLLTMAAECERTLTQVN